MRYEINQDKTNAMFYSIAILVSILVSILIYLNDKANDEINYYKNQIQTLQRSEQIITANPVNTPIMFSVYVNMDIIHIHENLSISSDKFGYLTTLENYKEVLIFLDENSYIDPIRKSNYRY